MVSDFVIRCSSSLAGWKEGCQQRLSTNFIFEAALLSKAVWGVVYRAY
jgi:hypothetical protein